MHGGQGPLSLHQQVATGAHSGSWTQGLHTGVVCQWPTWMCSVTKNTSHFRWCIHVLLTFLPGVGRKET